MDMGTMRRIPIQYLLVGGVLLIVLIITLLYSSRRAVHHPTVTVINQDNRRVYIRYDTSKYIDNKGHIVVPPDNVLEAMSDAELEELFFRYQETIETICPRQRHIGDEHDGGYHVCETLLDGKPCMAYSFGNRKDYTFDDGLAAYYKCEVHSFDPDDTQVDHKHSDLVSFHKIGIGGKDEIVHARIDMNIKTFDSIRTLLHHEKRKLDLLKIDAEGAEWPALKQMIQAQSLQRANVSMLIVEFHTIFFKRQRSHYFEWLQTMRGLYEAGYRRYFYRMWHGGCIFTNKQTGLNRTGCHETHFMKVY